MFHERIHTTLIDDESMPWIPFAPYNEEVLVKYLKLDPVRGESIALIKAPAGATLPRHQHGGSARADGGLHQGRHFDQSGLARHLSQAPNGAARQ